MRLSLQTGERKTQRFPWADEQSGGSSRLGRLDWSLVVLDELTVDLEVSVELCPREPDGAPGLVLLQEVQRGRTFRGSFEPCTDARLAAPEGRAETGEGIAGCTRDEVEAVIFDFSNTFSWWTPKEVELIALRVRPSGPPLASVPPLLALRPLSPPPRGSRALWGAGPHNGEAVLKGSPAAAPELRAVAPLVEQSRDLKETHRFAALLDAFLAAAEDGCPSGAGGNWLEDLCARVAALRGLCQNGLPSAGDTVAHAAEKDAAAAVGLVDPLSDNGRPQSTRSAAGGAPAAAASPLPVRAAEVAAARPAALSQRQLRQPQPQQPAPEEQRKRSKPRGEEDEITDHVASVTGLRALFEKPKAAAGAAKPPAAGAVAEQRPPEKVADAAVKGGGTAYYVLSPRSEATDQCDDA